MGKRWWGGDHDSPRPWDSGHGAGALQKDSSVWRRGPGAGHSRLAAALSTHVDGDTAIPSLQGRNQGSREGHA